MMKNLLVAGSVCAIFLAAAHQQGPDAGQTRGGEKQATMFQKCAEECGACQRTCDSCAAHCADLLGQGKKEHRVTLGTCEDCATHCSAAASIVARKGPFADLICRACAEACVRCAKECDKHASHDMEMKQCADACRKCEQACKNMISQLTEIRTTERRGN